MQGTLGLRWVWRECVLCRQSNIRFQAHSSFASQLVFIYSLGWLFYHFVKLSPQHLRSHSSVLSGRSTCLFGHYITLQLYRSHLQENHRNRGVRKPSSALRCAETSRGLQYPNTGEYNPRIQLCVPDEAHHTISRCPALTSRCEKVDRDEVDRLRKRFMKLDKARGQLSQRSE